ncbi:MAG: hypothetical protein ABEJ03_06335 [Candidatus Nanohaloarchaea archaeon]
MKLQEKPNGQFVITVPKKFVNAKGWEKGEELEWKISSEGVIELHEK